MILDLVTRLVVAAVYLWAAVEVARVGEKASAGVHTLMFVAGLAGATWWALLAILDPPSVSYRPWWTLSSRVAPILMAVGVAVMSRRRREINGYH